MGKYRLKTATNYTTVADKIPHAYSRFGVHEDTTNTIMGFRPISSRPITIRLGANPFNITVIQAYALASDYDYEAVEDFYDKL